MPLRGEAETFQPINGAALLTRLDPEQTVVRLEDLRFAGAALAADISVFFTAFGNAGARPPKDYPVLNELVAKLNARPKGGGRPRFATFLDEVKEDVAEADWPHRLRDRLGLSHLTPGGEFPELPVALMRYTLKDVIDQTPAAARGRVAAIPTVLDGPVNPYFFPAPTALAFGRTIGLDHDAQCLRLVSEILHRPLRYRAHHIYKLGVISVAPPEFANPIRLLRNTHRVCVSLEADLADEYGAAIPEHTHG